MGQVNVVGSTYYASVTDPSVGSIGVVPWPVRILTSTSPFGPYNTLAATYPTQNMINEWPLHLQDGSGNGTFYEDESYSSPLGGGYATFTDGVLGTSSLSSFTRMSGWPTDGTSSFTSQAFNIYKLPAVVLP